MASWPLNWRFGAATGALSGWVEVRRDRYEAYAAERAGARPEGKGRDYFDDLGFYASRLEHNQFARYEDGPDAELYPVETEFFWEWDRDESRQRYRELRNASQHAQRQALYMTGLVVVNHLVAAIHAARVASADQAQTGFAPKVVVGPSGSGFLLSAAFLLMACFFLRVALAVWMLSLPLAAAAEERICGTRWLDQHRASFPTQLSDSTELAAKAVGASQELGPH